MPSSEDPKLMEALRTESESRPARPPKGWMTLNEIMRSIGKTMSWIQLRVPRLLAEHPEWSPKDFLDRSGHVIPHQHPELIAGLINM